MSPLLSVLLSVLIQHLREAWVSSLQELTGWPASSNLGVIPQGALSPQECNNPLSQAAGIKRPLSALGYRTQ